MKIIPDQNDDNKLDLFVAAPTYSVLKQYDFWGKTFVFTMDGPVVTSTNHAFENNELSIYPNPSNGQITLNGLDENLGNEVVVRTTNGQIIYHQHFEKRKTVSIQLPPLASGIYFITVSTNDETQIKKLIIN